VVSRRIGDRMVVQVTARTIVLAAVALLAASYLVAGVFITMSSARRKDDAFKANFDSGVVVVRPAEPDTQEPAEPAPIEPAPEAPRIGGNDELRSL
jgi:hypothetical protein